MGTKAKGQSLWARALTIVLMLLLATASPLAHIVLPQAHADHRSSVDSGSQHAHHDTHKAMDTHLASQGRLAIYSAPELLSEGVDPDVLPPPPKLS